MNKNTQITEAAIIIMIKAEMILNRYLCLFLGI
jgi:hypothetical protein